MPAKLDKLKGANKASKIHVERSTTIRNLFCGHTLSINYVTEALLLVSCLDRSKQLLYSVHGQSEQKHIKQRTSSVFITARPLYNYSRTPIKRTLPGKWEVVV